MLPACFLGAGLIGSRLGTPPRVVGGFVAVGCSHLLAFLGANQARPPAARPLTGSTWSRSAVPGRLLALVWLAVSYPTQRPSTTLVAAAGALGVTGPLLAAVSGPDTALVDDKRELGPLAHILPEALLASQLRPFCFRVLAVVTFAARYRRAAADDRAAMRWPIAGLALISALAVAGTLLGPDQQGAVTALFLLGAPVFPLALAFGPVVRRLDALSSDLAEVRDRLARRTRPPVPRGLLARLTPRELTVLAAMADGMANPVIARTMHLSLSSVEKHATSIFRKRDLPAGPRLTRSRPHRVREPCDAGNLRLGSGVTDCREWPHHAAVRAPTARGSRDSPDQ